MATRGRRDLGLFIAGLAAGVVLALLPQWLSDPPVETAASPTVRGIPDAALGVDREPGLVGSASGADATKEAPAYEGTSAEAARDSAATSGAETILIVKPVGEHWDPQDYDAEAYALVAGTNPTEELEHAIPMSEYGPGYRLQLAAGGTYDVGVVDGTRRVMVRDVEIATGTTKTVEVEMPPRGELRFMLGGDAVPSRYRVNVFYSTGGDDVRAYPGRDQRYMFAQSRHFEAGDERELIAHVPLDQELRVSANVTRLVDGEWGGAGDLSVTLTPATVRAGDVVRVTLARGRPVALMAKPVPHPRVPIYVRLEVRVAMEGRPEMVVHTGVPLPGGEDQEPAPISLVLPMGTAQVSWTGEHVKPGATTIEVAPQKPNSEFDGNFPITLEPKTSWSVLETYAGAAPPGTPEIRIDWQGIDAAAMDEFWPTVIGVMPDPLGGRVQADMDDVDAEDDEDGEPYWALLPRFAGANRLVFNLRAQWVSKPIRPSRSPTLRVRLVRGGLLVVAPADLVGMSAGAWQLARADGNALYGLVPDEDEYYVSWASMRADVHPGTVIGPLPPGTYRFRVWLGQTALRDVTATVVAGRTTPLVLKR